MTDKRSVSISTQDNFVAILNKSKLFYLPERVDQIAASIYLPGKQVIYNPARKRNDHNLTIMNVAL